MEKRTPCSHGRGSDLGVAELRNRLLRRHHLEPCVSSSSVVGGPEPHRGWAGEVAALETGITETQNKGPVPITEGLCEPADI